MQPPYVEAALGGFKHGGIGLQIGTWGVEEHLNVKPVHIYLSEQPKGMSRSMWKFTGGSGDIITPTRSYLR